MENLRHVWKNQVFHKHKAWESQKLEILEKDGGNYTSVDNNLADGSKAIPKRET